MTLQTVVAAVAAWLAVDLLLFWAARVVVAEVANPEPAAAIQRPVVVRQLDWTILFTGLALVAALITYVAIGLSG